MNDDLQVQVDELRQRVESLTSDVRELQDGYAREVRTQRVTVVDEDGVERVVLSTRENGGSVLVRLDRPAGQTTGAELYAWDDPDSDASDAGVCLVREGDLVAEWPEVPSSR